MIAAKVSATFWRGTPCLSATWSQGNSSSQVSAMSTMRFGECFCEGEGVGIRGVRGEGGVG